MQRFLYTSNKLNVQFILTMKNTDGPLIIVLPAQIHFCAGHSTKTLIEWDVSEKRHLKFSSICQIRSL